MPAEIRDFTVEGGCLRICTNCLPPHPKLVCGTLRGHSPAIEGPLASFASGSSRLSSFESMWWLTLILPRQIPFDIDVLLIPDGSASLQP